jgi:hypothetical protein
VEPSGPKQEISPVFVVLQAAVPRKVSASLMDVTLLAVKFSLVVINLESKFTFV